MSKFKHIKPRDVDTLKDCSNWKEIFKIIAVLGLRYRTSFYDVKLLNEIKVQKSNKLSHSKVKKVIFL